MGPLPSLRYASEFGAGLSGMISWSFLPIPLYWIIIFSCWKFLLSPAQAPSAWGYISYHQGRPTTLLDSSPKSWRQAGDRMHLPPGDYINISSGTCFESTLWWKPKVSLESDLPCNNAVSDKSVDQSKLRFLRWALDKVYLTIHISVEVFTAGMFLFLPCTRTKV